MSRFDTIILILLVLVNLICFRNIFQNEFVWDDRPLIVHDYHIRSLRYLRDIFIRDFFSHSDEEVKYGYYRPLITLSYLWDFTFWRLNPAGFHLTNLLFHIANCWLIYLLALHFFPFSRGVGAGAAVLFAVHPVHTESVTWIAGRTDVVCTFFFLLSLLLFLTRKRPGARENQGNRGTKIVFRKASHANLYRRISFSSLLLALLAKEMALVLPLIIFLYEYIQNKTNFKRAVRQALPYAAVVLFYLAWRFFVARVHSAPKGEESFFVILLSMLKTFWFYVFKLIWPVSLSAYVQNPYLTNLFQPVNAVIVAFTLLLASFLWRWRRNQTGLIFLSLAFIACFLPLSNIIRISAPEDMGFPMAERFLYLPSVFFVLFLGGIVSIRWPRSRFLLAAGAGVFFCWGLLTFNRNRDWKEEGNFFRQAIDQSPSSPYLYANLGEHYSRRGNYEAGAENLEKAIVLNRKLGRRTDLNLLNNLAAAYRMAKRNEDTLRVLEEARSRGYTGSSLEYNLGMVLLEQRRLPEARRALQRALKLRPHSLDTWLGLARVFRAEKRYDEAVRCYREALSLFPDSSEIHNRLGVIYKEARDYTKALNEYGIVLRHDPDHAVARANRGVVYALLNNLEAAQKDLESAVVRQPELWDAQNALGMVYAKLGWTDRAKAKFGEILKANSGDLEARLNRGILFYQEGALSAAQKEFEDVLEIQPGHPRARRYLQTLKELLQSEDLKKKDEKI